MKIFISLLPTLVLVLLSACSHPPQMPSGAVRSGRTGTTDSDQIFTLEHKRVDHPSNQTNRLESVYWRLMDDHQGGALRNQPVSSGEILEWRSKDGPKGTNFCIAVPISTDPLWIPADPAGGNHPWYNSNLGSQFPPNYQIINAWQDSNNNYVVRLLLSWNTMPTIPIHYLIAVPPYDQQHKEAPYDYYMVDATLIPTIGSR